MATQFYATPIDHSTDPGMRAWVQEFSTALQAAGLVKTSDTGQFNFTTATRTTNQPSGYEIYRLNDSLSSSRPVFFKIEYGSSGSPTQPQIWVTVGNGSNGSGTLTGQLSSRSVIGGGTISSTTTNFDTRICVTDGAFWFTLKAGSMGITNRGPFIFSYERGVNDSGALLSSWGVIQYSTSTATSQSRLEVFDYILNNTFTIADGSQAVVVGGVSSSLVGTDVQVYTNFVPTPRVRPRWSCFTVLESEFANGSTFTTIPVGSTVSHTYIALGANSRYMSINLPTSTNIAMVWE